MTHVTSIKWLWKITGVGKDMEKSEPWCAVGGDENGAATRENGIEVLQKVKYRITV